MCENFPFDIWIGISENGVIISSDTFPQEKESNWMWLHVSMQNCVKRIFALMKEFGFAGLHAFTYIELHALNKSLEREEYSNP